MSTQEHFTKFETYALAIGIDQLTELIPASREEVEEALKTDEHLNNISLRKWDAKHEQVRSLASRRARLAGGLCPIRLVSSSM